MERGRKKVVWGVAIAAIVVAVAATAAYVLLAAGASVEVPNLEGMDLARVERELDSLGLTLGDVGFEIVEVSSATSGTVVAQDPQAGDAVDEGAPVSVTLAVGVVVLAEAEEEVAESPAGSGATVAPPAGDDDDDGEEPPPPERLAYHVGWVSVQGGSGRGPWESKVFESEFGQIKLVAILYARTGEAYSFGVLREDRSGGASLGLESAYLEEVVYTKEILTSPGWYTLVIDAPESGTWTFKLYDLRKVSVSGD